MTSHTNYFLSIIEEICGAEGVQRVVRDFGGLAITIPAAPKAHHRLCQSLGLEHVRRIVEVFGFGRVDVPLYTERTSARRQRIASEMLAAGESSSRVARELGVSRRTVERYRSASRGSTQMSRKGQFHGI